MKQRVITAVVLLALLAVVVWQINTPVLVLVIAFLAAVAGKENIRWKEHLYPRGGYRLCGLCAVLCLC